MAHGVATRRSGQASGPGSALLATVYGDFAVAIQLHLIKDLRKVETMKQLLIAALFAAAALSTNGQAKAAAAPTAQKASVESTLKQMERDWGNAQIKKDYDAVDKLIADDWEGIDYDGKVVAKADYMAHMRSGQSTLLSEEIGAMKVRVFGNTAIVTGSDTEKSTDRGKSSSGKYVWTDVFVMRNGKWQVVASQSTVAK